MKSTSIDINHFFKVLKPLILNLDEDNRIFNDPMEAFESMLEDGHTVKQLEEWEQSALVIFIEDMPTWRFDPTQQKWFEANPRKSDFRIFRVLTSGLMDEVTPYEESTSRPWFKVDSPHEAYAFIHFLTKFSKKTLKPFKEETLPANSLIERIFVPFYRYPDDLPQKHNTFMWTDVKPLEPLINKHFDNNLQWMEAPLIEIKRQEMEQDLKQNFSNSEQSHSKNYATYCERERTIFQSHVDQYQKWIPEYTIHAAKLQDKDFLSPSQSWKTFDANVNYGSDFYGRPSFSLRIKALLDNRCFPPFFSSEVNPTAFKAISSAATNSFVTIKNKTASLELPIPPFQTQARIAFETKRNAYRVQQISEHICNFIDDQNPNPDYSTQSRRVLARYNSMKRIREALPSDEQEIARATQPLPYFFEIPILHWERPNKSNHVFLAFACLTQIIKTTCLLGLEELHAVRSNIEKLPPFPKGLLEGLMTKPSLGHWARAIDHIAKLKEHFNVWGEWIAIVHSERIRINKLIEIRNEISHPDFTHDPQAIPKAAKEFEDLLNDLIPKLRVAVSDVEILLPESRKTTRNEDGQVHHTIHCLNLKTAHHPFPHTDFPCSNIKANQIFENVLFSAKGSHIVPLNHFFKVEDTANAEPEIYIYEKNYSGSEARMTGILSGLASKESQLNDIFTFGC